MIEELELKIVRSLNQNSRKSFREIAKEIGTSAPVVINKIKRLEKLGAIKGYIPLLDPEYFGFNLIAVVGW
jgi:DNA-binding Lrp family transcriptional regulator